MRLIDAARHFDDQQVYDAYTLLPLFKGQFTTFDEANPDGSIAKRRSMSLAPSINLPARKALKIFNELWLAGEQNIDTVFNRVIRQTVPLRRITDTFTVLTPGEAVIGAAGTSLYGRKDFLKDTVNSVSTSDYFPFYNIFVSTDEIAPTPRGFLRDGKNLYRARSMYRTADGFNCLESDQIDLHARTMGDLKQSAYDPVTDSHPAGLTTIPVLVMQPHQLYIKKTEMDPTFQAGDLTVLMRITDGAPVPGQEIGLDLDDVEWIEPSWWAGTSAFKILTVTAEQDAWNLHVRRS